MFAFKCALDGFIATRQTTKAVTTKIDNDDIDETKGCEIVVTVAPSISELEISKIPQTPQHFTNNSNELFLYAGIGVGVVTKQGLKIKPNFPAINPTPLSAIQTTFETLTKYLEHQTLYCAIGVTNGEEIAKRTANEKVGILGGISILGTTGFVKPVSSSAYLASIETEIVFAKQNGYKKLIFTLGNSAFQKALADYDKEQIIEIGNYVFDSIKIALNNNCNDLYFLCGIGKMTKLAQGFKNTHNKFGDIDFTLLQKTILENLGIIVDINSTKTVKGIVEQLGEKEFEFYKLIETLAAKQLKEWFNIDIYCKVLETSEVYGW